MGRHYGYSSKTEADYLKKIEISWLKKHGFLAGWKSGSIEWTNKFANTKSSVGVEVSIGSKYMHLYYTTTFQDGETKDFDYKIWLTTTPCRYGGSRYWFICPLVKDNVACNKRMGVLYKASDYFGCRKCQNLTYSSQKENRRYRLQPLFTAFRAETEYDKIWQTMKRQTYAGKPTKKYRKLLDLERISQNYMALLKGNNLLL